MAETADTTDIAVDDDFDAPSEYTTETAPAVDVPPRAVTIVPAAATGRRKEAVARVRDHGPGLPGDEPQAVFERFWRGSASRGRDDGGSGLGLAIVAAVLNAHGGRVEAANPSGGGAEFTVRLPLAQGDGRERPNKT